MKSKQKKVFVGLSGGVDSSVAAFLLKKQGFDVVGVFIKAWYPDFIPCSWREEMRDAMRICAKLGIPFRLLDAEKEYKKKVIDYMITEYSIGKTPNPDVMCNKKIKFKVFLDYANKEGADFIATGHYAQVSEIDGKFALLKSVDTQKDQTYFLWNLTSKILSKTLFPIGHLEKKKVRDIAKKNNLLTATKKDSQGLCFIGHVDMKEFLKKYLKTKSGDVLNVEGEVIGKHQGAILYTFGERHNFEIFNKNTNNSALFVVSKDLEKNTITVSPQQDGDRKDQTKVEKLNWVREVPQAETLLKCKIRYRQPDQSCVIKAFNNNQSELLVTFSEQQIAISLGQSIVFYNNKECIGGGIFS